MNSLLVEPRSVAPTNRWVGWVPPGREWCARSRRAAGVSGRAGCRRPGAFARPSRGRVAGWGRFGRAVPPGSRRCRVAPPSESARPRGARVVSGRRLRRVGLREFPVGPWNRMTGKASLAVYGSLLAPAPFTPRLAPRSRAMANRSLAEKQSTRLRSGHHSSARDW